MGHNKRAFKLKIIKYQSACSKRKIRKKIGRSIHQIPKLLVLTLVYRLLGNETFEAKYSAAVELVIDILRDV